jgi:hypothetical protein
VEWPAVDVGMKKHLYGFTLYILAFLVKHAIPSVEAITQNIN